MCVWRWDWVWALPILGGLLDVCLCFGCGDVGVEWAGGLGPWSGVVGLCYVCVRCESGFSV